MGADVGDDALTGDALTARAVGPPAIAYPDLAAVGPAQAVLDRVTVTLAKLVGEFPGDPRPVRRHHQGLEGQRRVALEGDTGQAQQALGVTADLPGRRVFRRQDPIADQAAQLGGQQFQGRVFQCGGDPVRGWQGVHLGVEGRRAGDFID